MYKVIIVYFVMINLAGIYLMYRDKKKARQRAWRIPEKTFFIISLCGGSVGSWAGIYLFRHKTKHLTFVIGIPFIFVLQLFLAAYIMNKIL